MPRQSAKVVQLATSPRARPLPEPPERSDPASPSLQIEGLEEAVSDLVPLFVRYHQEAEELPRPPLDPDWQGLLREATFGRVLLITARHEGVLVGFALNMIYPHVFHRATLHSQTHEWLDPAYRIGLFGLRLIRFNTEMLREKGVKRMFIATPIAALGKLYERVGYAFLEAVYVRTFL